MLSRSVISVLLLALPACTSGPMAARMFDEASSTDALVLVGAPVKPGLFDPYYFTFMRTDVPVTDEWKRGRFFVVRNYDVVFDPMQKEDYIVNKIPPGEYRLESLSFGVLNNPRVTICVGPSYSFTVAPGQILYAGDFQLLHEPDGRMGISHTINLDAARSAAGDLGKDSGLLAVAEIRPAKNKLTRSKVGLFQTEKDVCVPDDAPN
ncbi:MAG TPA: hypothetical protein VEB20_23225 [Azospirillaceae bacterium]|nr:hypothetical protein [Azospirillaceae bacterium]